MARRELWALVKTDKNRQRRAKRREIPKEERRKQNRKRYLREREKFIARAASTRAQGNGPRWIPRDLRRQLYRQRHRCFWCEEPLESDYHVDHVTPLARGGTNGSGNIVASCPACNWARKNKLPVEWRKRKAA